MYYSFLCLSKAQHNVKLIPDVQQLFSERGRKKEQKEVQMDRGREGKGTNTDCTTTTGLPGIVRGHILVQRLVCASHLRACVFFSTSESPQILSF